MSRFPELHRGQFQEFLQTFSRPGTLKFRNNKWVGLNRNGKPFVVHVKHGTTRKYPGSLVEAVAGISGYLLKSSGSGSERRGMVRAVPFPWHAGQIHSTVTSGSNFLNSGSPVRITTLGKPPALPGDSQSLTVPGA